MAVEDRLRVRMEVIDKTTEVLRRIVKNLGIVERSYKQVAKSTTKNVVEEKKHAQAVRETSGAVEELLGKLGALALAYKALGAVKATMLASDDFVSAEARIGLITNEPKTMMDEIYQLSQETRSNFMEMSGVVSKMGINVGVGEGQWFGDTSELIKFNELLTKTFKLGGQNNKEVNAAMLQLTQAMSSGRLQGDEFRSMFENSPLYIKYIGEYLGALSGAVDANGNAIAYTTGELKEMAAQGLITTDIMIDAMFYAADEIENKFETLPRTFEQRWEQMKNMLLQQSRTFLNALNDIVDNESFDNFLNQLSGQLTFIMGLVTSIMEKISPIINFVLNHWNIVSPILVALGTYIGYIIVKVEILSNATLRQEIATRKLAYAQAHASTMGKILDKTNRDLYFTMIRLKGADDAHYASLVKLHKMVRNITLARKIENTMTKSTITMKILEIAVKVLHIKTLTAETLATKIATGAAWALNVAIYQLALPFIAFLGIVWALIKGLNMATGSSYTLAQVLVGTLGVAAVTLYNIFVPLYNLIVAITNGIIGLSTGNYHYYDYAKFKKIDEGWAWGDKYKNNSTIDYQGGDFEASGVVSDKLLDYMGNISENTDSIKDNTGMTNEDVSFLRALAEDRVGNRLSSNIITVNNYNDLNIQNDRDLSGLVDQLAKELEETLNSGAAGVHI